MKIKVLIFLVISFALFAPAFAFADLLLVEKFDKTLDFKIWMPGDPAFVYAEKGVLVLNQKASKGDYVSIRTRDSFPDCVIYYQWTLAEYSGQGDCGGYLRKDLVKPGGYIMRWGWGNTVNLTDSQNHPPINAWQNFPDCKSPYPANSINFELKASLKTPEIKVKIRDLDTGKLIADWKLKDDWY